MLELLLCICAAGLIGSTNRRMGFCNPFQIYFAVWLLVLTGYALGKSSFIPLSGEFLLMMVACKGLALALLVVAYSLAEPLTPPGGEDWRAVSRSTTLRLIQLGVIVAAPLTYLKATTLSGGESVFSVMGYIYLRQATTDHGLSLGIWSYTSILSVVVTAVVLRCYFEKHIRWPWMVVSVIITLFDTYLSTGRTFVLFSLLIIVTPLVVIGRIRAKGIAITAVSIIGMFALIATMTAKGVSTEADLGANLLSLGDNLRSYTVAPFLAFSKLVELAPSPDWGVNSFRFFYAILNALGLADNPPVLIREYSFVPDPVNVYSAYEVYFRDFSYPGVFALPLFLIGHWWLYRRARGRGGLWVFLYSASLYPLAMQFFQDQYFSLLSMWVQITFWSWLLLRPLSRKRPPAAP